MLYQLLTSYRVERDMVFIDEYGMRMNVGSRPLKREQTVYDWVRAHRVTSPTLKVEGKNSFLSLSVQGTFSLHKIQIKLFHSFNPSKTEEVMEIPY